MSSLSFSTSWRPDEWRLVAVWYERQGVDRLAVDEHVELHQLRRPVAGLLVSIEA